MVNMMKYLSANDKRQIRDGKSGAEVWEIGPGHVLKYVRRESLPDPEMFRQYQNEAFFYRFFMEKSQERLPCLPEISEVQVSDHEILILMKKYQRLFIGENDKELLRRIMKVLAGIHTREVPDFLKKEKKQPEYFTTERIESCRAGWQSVLAEHPGVFDEGILTEAAANINEVIRWHHGEIQVLTHGDFHRDNLLRKDNGEILVCDWQGVGQGSASGDISFFLSRLGADGISIEPKKAAALYCREREELTGETISPRELLRHMQAANLITSFLYWHEYLHGSSAGRVREVYEKMVME